MKQPWADWELRFLDKQLGRGLSYSDIAHKLGRSKESVRHKVRSLYPKKTSLWEYLKGYLAPGSVGSNGRKQRPGK